MDIRLAQIVIDPDPPATGGIVWDLENLLIDWISYRATRPKDFPEQYAHKITEHRLDGDYTDFERKSIYRGCGSHYLIKSVDDYVNFWGNPSRLDRPDNVFGLDWPHTLKKLDSLNHDLGYQGELDINLSRIDLTLNVATGSPENARAYLQQLRYQEMRQLDKHFSPYGSVAWHNKSKRIHVYDKALELEHKYKKLVKDEAISWLTDDKQVDEHIAQLITYLRMNGIVRVELKLMRSALVSRGIRIRADITEKKLKDIFKKETQPLKKMTLENGNNLGWSEYGVFIGWLRGHFDYSNNKFDRKTLYKYRRCILKETGYDIKSDGPVALDRPTKVINTYAAEIPDWYANPNAS